MKKIILYRVIVMLSMLVAGIVLLYLLVRIAPGSSTSKYLSTGFNIERQQQLERLYNDNQPLTGQIITWLKRAVVFDFGKSLQSGREVKTIILQSLKPTLWLTLLATFWGLIIGFPAALISAIHKHTKLDHILSVIMIILFSLPAFWLGLFLLQFFAVHSGWFPSSQLFQYQIEEVSHWRQLTGKFYHLFLPSFSLGLGLAAYFYKYFKNELINILDSEYILAARVMGLSMPKIIFYHVAPNLTPHFLALLTSLTPMLFSGAVTIEYIFSIPGLGRTMVHAAIARDLPLIMGGATLSFLLVMVLNSILEIMIFLINPQIRSELINEKYLL
ncbi:MAG: ABC transporter permease [Fidelibacterota bacterium]